MQNNNNQINIILNCGIEEKPESFLYRKAQSYGSLVRMIKLGDEVKRRQDVCGPARDPIHYSGQKRNNRPQLLLGHCAQSQQVISTQSSHLLLLFHS
jgi:hypothetical protein